MPEEQDKKPKEKKDEEKQVVIDTLKALKGVERKLQSLLK